MRRSVARRALTPQRTPVEIGRPALVRTSALIPRAADRQAAGFRRRGTAVRDKGLRALPRRGRFCRPAEFLFRGSNGDFAGESGAPCLPGVFHHPVEQSEGKRHLAAKPVALMAAPLAALLEPAPMADRRPGFRFPGPLPKEALDYFRGRDLRPGFSYRDVWLEEHALAFTVAKAMVKEALDYFRGRDLRPGFSYRDVWLEEHAYAFTVAKAMEMDLLADIRAEIDRAIAEGRTLAQFQKDLPPILRKKGWWGKEVRTDPQTGKTVPAQPGSPNRLRAIYRSHLLAARAAGQWDRAQRTKKTHPCFLYELGPGEKQCDRHRAWAGTLLPVDDPWWDDHFPPNGRDCECRVRQISEAEAERRGGATARPPRNARTMTNPRTGMRFEVDNGLDPAWASNPGKFRGKILMEHLNSTIDAADPALARAAVLSLQQGPIPRRFHRQAGTFAKENPEIANADIVEIKDQGFKNRLGHLPVALFGDRARAKLKPLTGPEVTPTRVVVLSPETAVKQAAKHPEIGMSQYRLLPELIEKGEIFESRKKHHLLFFHRFDDRLYGAVVKQTRNNELFLTSFHDSQRRNRDAAQRQANASLK